MHTTLFYKMKKITKYIIIAALAAFASCNLANAKEALTGCFAAFTEYADLKVTKSLTGKYSLHVNDKKGGEWNKLGDLRPASNEEVRRLFGDRVAQIEEALVFGDGLFPAVGLFYAKPGQFGLEVLTEPTYIMYVHGQPVRKINKMKCE
jgi:hypothetical protein